MFNRLSLFLDRMIFFSTENVIFFVFLNENICCGAHLNRLIEMLPMSTHNVCFHQEIRILDIWMAPLFRDVLSSYIIMKLL